MISTPFNLEIEAIPSVPASLSLGSALPNNSENILFLLTPHIKPILSFGTIFQPDFNDKNYITSILFKLKDKAAALYSALSGFALNGVNLTKLQSFPEKNSFSSYFFLCELDGHIEEKKVKNSLEELGLHCDDMHVLGVFEADKYRDK